MLVMQLTFLRLFCLFFGVLLSIFSGFSRYLADKCSCRWFCWLPCYSLRLDRWNLKFPYTDGVWLRMGRNTWASDRLRPGEVRRGPRMMPWLRTRPATAKAKEWPCWQLYRWNKQWVGNRSKLVCAIVMSLFRRFREYFGGNISITICQHRLFRSKICGDFLLSCSFSVSFSFCPFALLCWFIFR